MRILLAEDDRGSRSRLREVLEEWGYSVIVAATGEDALKELEREGGPRLAVLDWLMPGLEGIEVCKRVRKAKLRPYVYLMLLTQKGGQDDVIAGLNAGADDYLVKPINPAELYGRLKAGRRIIEVQAELLRMREELKRQALFDPVTRTLNRRGGFVALRREVQRSSRHKTSIAVVLADLDEFKAINDEYGHLAGDEVLREAAGRMGQVIRPYDVISRYGGEEFLIVLPGCNEDFAVKIIERCRERLAAEPVKFEDYKIPLTASFGVCSSPPRDGLLPEDLVAAADAALYRAKRSGRNRVEVAAPPAPQADTTI